MADTGESAPQRRFQAAELAQYDGKAGQPAYVVYKGKVYDVTGSKLWRGGVHVRAHKAGEDLTAAMPAAPHEDDVLARMPVVGILIEEREGPVLREPPWWAGFSLEHHLHPIAVHFPTALGAVAPVFALLSLVYRDTDWFSVFQTVAFWNLVICALSIVPAITTGILSWYFNYAAVITPIYRVKWGGSIVLTVLCISALTVKFAAVPAAAAGGAAFWVYMALLVLIAPTVVVLGHYGGKITFPS